MSLTYLEQLWKNVWQAETTDICKIETWREPDLSNHAEVNTRLMQIRDYLDCKVKKFNTEEVSTVNLTRFQWCQDGDKNNYDSPTDDEIRNSSFWVFGYRFGAENPQRKLAVICHLDTVPASPSLDDDWDPFNPSVKFREYPWEGCTDQDFLVGRGCVDDKGPAISAFVVARALAKELDGTDHLKTTQIQVIFDSSEETNMSTPHYIDSNREKYEPDMGVVFDAMWIVRAEKGCVRPLWTVDSVPVLNDSLYIESLITTEGNSENTIPDYAVAVIKGPADALATFASTVRQRYDDFVFDDDQYRKAKLELPSSETAHPESVTLKTVVAGAQHGSAPEENRALGANPLVSLSNFLAGLTTDGTLQINAPSSMCKFIQWMWGTRVFGENHSKLYQYDSVFEKDNGTTYAVTKTEMNNGSINLKIDVRYAIPHHIEPWDGETQGLIPGDSSNLETILPDLTAEFNTLHPECANVTFVEPTPDRPFWYFGPDIRIPETNPDFELAEQAFAEVVGRSPKHYAVGGGTDAKGNLKLLALGPLMTPQLGPPINYHGIGEGAPMEDMLTSTKILYRMLMLQVEIPHAPELPGMTMMRKKAEERLMSLRKRGYKFCCDH